MRTDYRKMPRAVYRDNKRNYNESGWYCSGYTMRVPSIKRSKKTWKNFYRLFPKIKQHLMSMGEYGIFRYGGKVTLNGNVYTVEDERLHSGAGRRNRTTKYLKIW